MATVACSGCGRRYSFSRSSCPRCGQASGTARARQIGQVAVSVGAAHSVVASQFGFWAYLSFLTGWSVLPGLAVYVRWGLPWTEWLVHLFVWGTLGLIPGIAMLVLHPLGRILCFGREWLVPPLVVVLLAVTWPWWAPVVMPLVLAGT